MQSHVEAKAERVLCKQKSLLRKPLKTSVLETILKIRLSDGKKNSELVFVAFDEHEK